MNIISILAWAVPLLTGGGLAIFIALLFLAPQLALVVEQVALAALKAVISTRIGCSALTALVVGSGAYFYGDAQGAERVQAQWDHAENAAIENGKDARSDAEKEIPDVEPDDKDASITPPQHHFPWIIWKRTNACPPAPTARPVCRTYDDRGVRNDPNNRDHH